MKKSILFLVAMACSVAPVSAKGLILNGNHAAKAPHSAPAFRAAEDADDEYLVFGYCQDYFNSVGTGEPGTIVGGAIFIPRETAALYTGNQLSHVIIGYGQSSYTRVNIFLTYSLDEEPFYTQQATMTVTNGWNNVKLDTPYDIEDKAFFVGYTTTQYNSTDYPVGIDGVATNNPNACLIGVNGEYEDYSSDFGAVCLKIGLTGETLPQYDVNVIGANIPAYVGVNQPFAVSLTLSNDAVRTIDEVEVSCSIDGVELDNLTVTLSPASLSSGNTAEVVVSGLLCENLGNKIPLEITIGSLNGNPDENPSNNTWSATINCIDKVFRQNVVVEEFTGTWCGYCVRGITGMKYMKENYGDDGYIGIGVHGNDAMAITAYQTIINSYSGGSFPSATVNRSITFDPSIETLEYYFKQYSRNPAVAGVAVDATYSVVEGEGDAAPVITFNIDASTEFGLDYSSAKFALAFVITEDHVGPYNQVNNYSGGKLGPMGGWESLPRTVPTYFNEVARAIETARGISGSVPSTIENSTVYNYSTSISPKNITDVSNCEVIAILLDTSSRRVINAAKVKPESLSVKDVVAGSEANVDIYAVNGGIAITGDYDLCTVFGIDGSTVKVASATPSVDVAPGVYVVKVVTADGRTASRKVCVK